MVEIGHTWDRHQWAGEGQRDDASAGYGDELGVWHFSQWIGDTGRAATERRRIAVRIDTSGGFSGFGLSDSGGQRWAIGYRDRSHVEARARASAIVADSPES
jgi:hypothetical protein